MRKHLLIIGPRHNEVCSLVVELGDLDPTQVAAVAESAISGFSRDHTETVYIVTVVGGIDENGTYQPSNGVEPLSG